MPGEKAPEQERREQLLRAAFEVATAAGLDGLTVRAVAERAGLSPGSVMFHFKSKDALILALLEWWFDRLASAADRPRIVKRLPPAEAIAAVLSREVQRFADGGATAQLFYDFWRLGTHRPVIRERIREEMHRYRSMFRPFAARLVAGRPDADPAADGVAALAVALVQGFAVQATVDPDALCPDRYIAMATRLLQRAGAAAATGEPAIDLISA